MPSVKNDDEPSFAEKYKWVFINMLLVVVYLAIGTIAEMKIQGSNFETAVYVVTQIITTIGYGDISVNDNFRCFMTFYVIIGLVLIASIVTDYATRAVTAAQEGVRARMRDVEGKGNKKAIEGMSEKTKALNGFVVSLAIFLAFIFIGALFYYWYEPCTCSYGLSKVAGCIETNADGEYDYNQCIATNPDGQRSYLAFGYMAVITLTTVGFGDVSPKTKIGRCYFGVPWMICGVVAFGNFVSCTSELIRTLKKGDSSGGEDALHEAFDEVDADDDGEIIQGEFVAWALISHGLVDADTIESMRSRYQDLKSKAPNGIVDKDFIMHSFTGEGTGSSSDEG